MDENGVWNVLDVVRLVNAINSTIYSAVSPAGRIKVASLSDESPASGVLLKQPYQVGVATTSNHLYLTQSSDDPAMLNLCLDNHDAVQALQADIVLPEGMTLIPEATSLTARCASTHTLKLVPVSNEDNRYRLVIWSMSTGIPFTENSGALVSLNSKQRDTKSESGDDVLKGFLEQTVLTGLNMTTLNSFSYETALEMPGHEPLLKVVVGTGPDGKLWVKGENLEHITVFDVTGRKVSELPCFGERSCSFTLRSGCYMVKVEQGKDSASVFKVLVP